MKTLYLTDSSANIVVDKEEDYVGTMPYVDRYDIRSVFYAEEPMHVIYQSGERKEEIDAKKGDLIILFYNNRFNKYILDTIRTKQWAANIKNRRAIEQKEREEWAAKNADCCDCEKCECADSCPCAPEPPVALDNTKECAVSKIKKAIKKVIKKAKK